MAGESKASVCAALAGNASIAVLKGTVALLTGSAAMLAETFHSIADTGNEALLLLGLHLSRRPPDRRHPFGHGMDVYFWAFVVSMMLFTLGGGFSIWEAVRTFLHGRHEQQDFTWAYVVLGGSALFEGGSFLFAVKKMRALMEPGESVRQFWTESRDPTIMTVLLEDSAALLSLAIAATGVFLVQRTGRIVWDAAASAAIGVVLLGVAVALAFENYSLLLGEKAPREVEQRVRSILEGEAAVERIAYLYSMHLGPDSTLLAIGVSFRPRLCALEIQETVQRLQTQIDDALGPRTSRRLIMIEPAAA